MSSGRRAPRRYLAVATLVTLAVLMVTGCSSPAVPSASSGTAPSVPAGTTPSGGRPPNIVFVLADDMARAELAHLPHVQELIGAQGATFENHLVSNTLCCPSRASILRGQYSHNTGVRTNTEPDGGFEAAHRLGIEGETIATTLAAAGYRTALFGKYLNGYPHTAPSWRYIPPGWAQWASPIQGAISEFDYTLNHNGERRRFGSAPQDYATDVYTRLSVDNLRAAAADGVPSFTYHGFYAPHAPSIPAPRHEGAFAGLGAPRTASYDEADTSDKPAYVRARPPLAAGQHKLNDTQFGQRVRALQAVDDAVVQLVGALDAAGELDNTYIVFTSDNGFHLGQHRLPPGKGTPYEEDVRVPLLVRGPGIAPGTKVTALTGNIDLAATFAEMAGVPPMPFEDGRSVLPLALAPGAATDVRRAYLLEHWPEIETEDEAARRAEAQTEPPDDATRGGPTTVRTPGADFQSLIPHYVGVRTARYKLVELPDSSEHELYDLETDPDELQNVFATIDPAIRAQLLERLAALRDCRGEQCRVADRQPTP